MFSISFSCFFRFSRFSALSIHHFLNPTQTAPGSHPRVPGAQGRGAAVHRADAEALPSPLLPQRPPRLRHTACNRRRMPRGAGTEGSRAGVPSRGGRWAGPTRQLASLSSAIRAGAAFPFRGRPAGGARRGAQGAWMRGPDAGPLRAAPAPPPRSPPALPAPWVGCSCPSSGQGQTDGGEARGPSGPTAGAMAGGWGGRRAGCVTGTPGGDSSDLFHCV